MPDSYIKRILNARVYDVAIESPLDPLPRLSRRLGNPITLKREDLQPVFSFKLRGAYNRIQRLVQTSESPIGAIVAASAGNHAQGVSLAAQRLGLEALIVMPRTTPEIKVDAVRALGGTPILHGDGVDEAFDKAKSLLEAAPNRVLIPPFDDPDVIAGQGTIGREILHQHRGDPQAIFVPVGGGGLIAGIAAYVKYLRPDIRVIGVEPDDAPTLAVALEAGEPVTLDQVGLFNDGVAVRRIGVETFRVARERVDEVVRVTSDEVCAAIKDIFEDTRAIAEPAGALAIAGLKRVVERDGLRDTELVAINSGANTNFDRLRHVAERAELGERREAILAVTIPEHSGSFRRFCRVLEQRAITEFNYRYADPTRAHVFVGLQLRQGPDERVAVITALRDAGYAVLDLSDNEIAKLHIRYMVGGHAPQAKDERIIRFEFPERPGALLRFLETMGEDWNISLFHYRNHGAAYGRVLAGVQVPEPQQPAFQRFLGQLGYTYWEETENPAYALFLGLQEHDLNLIAQGGELT
jgi:threonine dehydratase